MSVALRGFLEVSFLTPQKPSLSLLLIILGHTVSDRISPITVYMAGLEPFFENNHFFLLTVAFPRGAPPRTPWNEIF